MKCTYCNSPVEKGRIFCLKCGEEIVWVGEYNAIGSYRSQSQQAVREAARRVVENEDRQQALKEMEKIKNKKKKSKRMSWIITIIIVLIIGVGVLLGTQYYLAQRNYNRADYQLNAAMRKYNQQAYEQARRHIDRAVELAPDDGVAVMLKANILQRQGQSIEALYTLLALIEKQPDNYLAYEKVIEIYESEQRLDDIKILLDKSNERDILEQYSEYIAEQPAINIPGGQYHEAIKVEIYSTNKDGAVYYTTDGSEPTVESTPYTELIELPKGTTALKIIATNAKGITSNIVEAIYTINYLPPSPPEILPSSGEYTTTMNMKININIPNGHTAYYAFDDIPTLASNQYTQPLDMLEGKHTIYVIVVNEEGEQSDVGSAQYNLVKE